MASGRHHPLRPIERPAAVTNNAVRWLTDAVLGDRWQTAPAERMFTQVMEITRAQSPTPGDAGEGVHALVYRGHLEYNDEVFISPGLFLPVCGHVLVTLTRRQDDLGDLG